MTLIQGIEIDNVHCAANECRRALANNAPVDTTLHVVVVVSNPCQYARRYILARQFLQRLAAESSVVTYVVELAYGHLPKYYVTEAGNARHLQLTADTPLWHKENMVNAGVRALLPPHWKAMAWVDADIEFEDPAWATHALRLLNGYKDVVQLFSHAVDMDMEENAMEVYAGFGYQYDKGRPYRAHARPCNMWHPGFAWACTRAAYDHMGGLFDRGILGSGDMHMALAYLGVAAASVHAGAHAGYKAVLQQLDARARNFRVGYVPGVIRHFFHGSKKNRRYSERWQILVTHQYDATQHVRYLENGILAPTDTCPPGLLSDIMVYFSERNEDEGCCRRGPPVGATGL